MQQTLANYIKKNETKLQQSRFIDTSLSNRKEYEDIEPELLVKFNKLTVGEKNMVIKKGMEFIKQTDEILKNNLINNKVAKQHEKIEILMQTIKDKELDIKDLRKNLKEVKKNHANEIKDTTNQYKEEIKDLHTEHKKSLKEIKKEMNQSQKEEIENIRNNLESQYQASFEDKKMEIDNLKKDLLVIQKEKNTIENKILKENKLEIKQINEKYETKITNIEKNKQETIDKHIEIINNLQNKLNIKKQREQNSCLKGIDGEKFAENLTRKVFTPLRGDVIDVHGKGGQGDFVIEFEKNMYLDKKHTIMIDSKNYTSSVPLREVNKIKKDLIENTNYDAAILLSQKNVKISKKNSYLDFEFVKDEYDNIKPVMYITNVKEMENLLLQSYILLCIFLKNKEIIIKEEKMLRLKEKFNKISSLIAKETKDFNDYSKRKKEFIKELKQLLNDVHCDFLSNK